MWLNECKNSYASQVSKQIPYWDSSHVVKRTYKQELQSFGTTSKKSKFQSCGKTIAKTGILDVRLNHDKHWNSSHVAKRMQKLDYQSTGNMNVKIGTLVIWINEYKNWNTSHVAKQKYKSE